MERRDVLKLSSAALGYSLVGGSLVALMSGCKADPKETWQPRYFSSSQMELLEHLVELIIPRTDTPGANDALVHRYIDEAVGFYFPEQERDDFLASVIYVEEVSNTLVGSTFATATPENQIKVMDFLASEADKYLKHPFHQIRDLTISAFFSSEVGAKEVLHYDPVPGPYKGCVPLSEVGGTNSGI